MRKQYKIALFVFILFLAFILRFYKLGFVPDGLQQDESSIGYNAYSILKTGRDEHGILFPQNFKAFGEYKLPGYIYATVVPIALFGLSPFSIRFVSAISGFLSILIIFFLSRKLLQLGGTQQLFSKQEYLPYIISFLLAINPWHLQFSRAAFEVMLANFFILCGIWLFIKGIQSAKIFFILISILFFCASMYTYNIARLFTPVFIILLLFIFRKRIAAFPRWYFAAGGALFIACLLPFGIGSISHGGADSTLGTLITTSAKVQAPLQEFRSYFIDLPLPLNKLFNFWTLTAWQYINNIFAHLSVGYYFIGSQDGITSIGTIGYWYLFELPFVVWGIATVAKSKNVIRKILFSWIISLILIASLTREPPQATRTFFLIFPITFCSGLGLLQFFTYIFSFSKKKNTYMLGGLIIFVMLAYIVLYFTSYYVRFPIYYAKNWRTGDRDVALYIKNHQNEYDKILFDQSAGFIYTSLLTYVQYSPQVFQKTALWSQDDSEGFSHPTQFGKYEFRNIDWSKDANTPRTLIVTTANNKPNAVAPLETMYYPLRPVVFNVGQNIVGYPIADIAYVLVSSDNATKYKK